MAQQNQAAETFLAVIKKILKWAAIGLFIYWGGLFLLMYVFVHVASTKDTVQVKPLSEMNGVSLDESLGDVLFKKKEYKKAIADGSSLGYVTYGDGKYDVTFFNDKVIELNDTCEKVFVSEKGVNGVVCNESSEKIKSQYGDSLVIYCMSDNSRVYTSPKHNVVYYLKSNEVKRISVYKNIKQRESWIDCKDFKFKPVE